VSLSLQRKVVYHVTPLSTESGYRGRAIRVHTADVHLSAVTLSRWVRLSGPRTPNSQRRRLGWLTDIIGARSVRRVVDYDQRVMKNGSLRSFINPVVIKGNRMAPYRDLCWHPSLGLDRVACQNSLLRKAMSVVPKHTSNWRHIRI
jgi:hypothetical protein